LLEEAGEPWQVGTLSAEVPLPLSIAR